MPHIILDYWFLKEKVRIFPKRFWMRWFHSLVKMLLISVIQVLCEFVILLGWEWVGNGRAWLNRRWQKWDFQNCPGLHFLHWEHGQDITIISCLLVFSIFSWLLIYFFFPLSMFGWVHTWAEEHVAILIVGAIRWSNITISII